jgi:hypothetical protein
VKQKIYLLTDTTFHPFWFRAGEVVDVDVNLINLVQNEMLRCGATKS